MSSRFPHQRRLPPEGADPCQDLQAEISSLVDGEIDDAGMRRVVVHIEVCPACRRFLRTIRAQVGLHKNLYEDAFRGLPSLPEITEDPFAGDLFADVDEQPFEQEAAPLFDRMVQDGHDRLAEILYQLGKAYIVISRSTEFFTILTRELVPIPEYRLRGKMLVDGITGSRSSDDASLKPGWVEARHLLEGKLDSVQNNLDKGRCLLRESLQLRPQSGRAQVWLGQSFMQSGDHGIARRLLQHLVDSADGDEKDPVTKVPMRVYALESLGNSWLAENRPDLALAHFRLVVASGAMDLHPNFTSGPMNVAYAALQVGGYEEAAQAFELVYSRYQWRRREIGQRIALRTKIKKALDEQPQLRARLESSCPDWFGPDSQLVHGAEVQFQFVTSPLLAVGRNPAPPTGTVP